MLCAFEILLKNSRKIDGNRSSMNLSSVVSHAWAVTHELSCATGPTWVVMRERPCRYKSTNLVHLFWLHRDFLLTGVKERIRILCKLGFLMSMISLAVVGSINQSKSMLMMSVAVVGSINQSEFCQTHHGDLLRSLAAETCPRNFLQRLPVETSHRDFQCRLTAETSHGDLL